MHDDMAEYWSARGRYQDAKARGDTRAQHDAEIALKRQCTAALRTAVERPRWRRLLDAWRGRA